MKTNKRKTWDRIIRQTVTDKSNTPKPADWDRLVKKGEKDG